MLRIVRMVCGVCLACIAGVVFVICLCVWYAWHVIRIELMRMSEDLYYYTAEWRALRRAILYRDHHRCAVPGCRERAVIVDHIQSRNSGGSNDPKNLRSLCKLHDNQIKERSRFSRDRGRNGVLPSVCDANGMPMDPNHPWNKK